MDIIFARSPYTIEVAGDLTNQIETKVELYIWHKGETQPTTPIVLSKKIPSTTSRTGYYNISPFIKDTISFTYQPRYGNGGAIDTFEDDPNSWCYCRVKTYYKTTGNFIPLDDHTYVGLYSYSLFTEGANVSQYYNHNGNVLVNATDIYYWTQNYGGSAPYANWLLDYDGTSRYYTLYFSDDTFTHLIYAVPTAVPGIAPKVAGVYNFIVPFILNAVEGDMVIMFAEWDSVPGTENDFLNHYSGTTKNLIMVDECTYQPHIIDFINHRGGWEQMIFFKRSTESMEQTATDFMPSPQDWNYSTYQGQVKQFNVNGKRSKKVNSGWVKDEEYYVNIQDLLLSEYILLDGEPVKLKTTSIEKQTNIYDRTINYELDFEYLYNMVNNMI